MSLKKQTISGLKWTTISNATKAIGQILKVSVLARFLDKSDFGLMALVTFVLGFMRLFMDVGLTTAILHKQEISKNEYASLYWINIVFSIILYGILCSVSPLISGFYEETELMRLIPIMGLSLILAAIGGQFRTIEQKALNFRIIAVNEISASILSLILAVYLAYNKMGIYSLVYSTMFQFFYVNIIFFINGIKEHGLRFYFKFSETKVFLKIGLYQTGSQIVNYLNRDIDILIIGKFFGSEILGGYSLAKQLVRRPLSIIDPIISKVGMTIMPRFQNDNARLRKYFVQILKSLGGLNAIIYGSIILLAPYLVQLFYGSGFENIIIFVQIFALIVYFRSFGGQQGVLVITKGRTDLGFYWNLFSTILFPLVIYLGALNSIQWVLINILLAQIVLSFPAWYIFYKKLIFMNFSEYFRALFMPLMIILLINCIDFFVLNTTLFFQITFTIMNSLCVLIYLYFVSDEIKQYLQSKIEKICRVF